MFRDLNHLQCIKNNINKSEIVYAFLTYIHTYIHCP